jgi:hypothetical protein
MGPGARMGPKHPNELQHLNVDKCSLPQHRLTPPKLFGSDHGLIERWQSSPDLTRDQKRNLSWEQFDPS